MGPWCWLVPELTLPVRLEMQNVEEFLLSPGSGSSVSEPWSPSLQRSQRSEVPIQNQLHEPNENSGDWRCRTCGATSYGPVGDSTWQCLACGGTSFYDSRQPMKEVTDRGTWMYLPHGGEDRMSSSSRRRRRRKRAEGFPRDPSHHEDEEFAESERLTNDPIVDPDPVEALPERPQLRPGSQQGHQPHAGRGRGKGGADRDLPSGSMTSTDGKLLQTLQRLVEKDVGEWSSAKGPSKGVRWKSGQPPAPPIWKYDKEDLRAYSKFCKKIEIWKLQAAAYIPPKEMALQLYGSLQGECEQELEHMGIDEIYHEKGIDTILAALKSPMEQKVIYQKRRYLHEFEVLRRLQGETIRQYINRFRRSQRCLKSVGIDIAGTYDAESLGARLLDRSGLSPDNQRLVLVGTQQQLSFELVAESMNLQYPDFRGAPPLHGKEGSKGSGKSSFKGSRPTSSSSSMASTSSGKGHSFRPSSTSSSSSTTRAAYVAEAQDGDDAVLDTIQEDNADADALEEDGELNDDGDDQEEELIPDDQEEEINLEELSHVLTVTARRLAGVTLGRKFSSRKPGTNTSESADIAKRKQASHCAACGARGHWKDDDICPMKGKTSSSSRQSSSSGVSKFPKSKASPKQPSQAFQVVHHEHGRVEVSDEGFGNMFQCNMVMFPQQEVNEVLVSSTDELVGFLVLDSACQRTCCGERWYHEHTNMLTKKFKLTPKEISCDDVFQFGKGAPQTAEFRSYLPTCLDEQQPFLLATAVLKTGIPLLGSSKLLQRLGTILNMPDGLIHFRTLGCTMPLLKHNGHLVVDIMKFPKDVQHLACWKKLSNPELWHEPDSELMAVWNEAENSQALTISPTASSAPRLDAINAAGMDVQLAPSGEGADGLRQELCEDDGGSCDAGISTNVMAVGVNPAGDGPADPQGSSKLQPRLLQEVRQQTRPVCKVPRVRHKVSMERDHKEMGPGGGFAATIALITIATSLLKHYHIASETDTNPGNFQQGEAKGQGLSQSTSLYYDFLDWYARGEGKNLELDPQHGTSGCGPRHDPRGDRSRPSRPGDEHGLLPPGACGRHRQDVDFQHESREKSSVPGSSRQCFGRRGVRLGTGRRLRGTLKNNINNLESEMKIYEALASVVDRPPPYIDILELFSGASKFTLLAAKHHLNALQPMDLDHGQDFHDPEIRDTTLRAMKKFKPWLSVIGIRCTKWSQFNINLNYSWRLDQLRQEQEAEMPLVSFTCDACDIQYQGDRYFLVENPLKSKLWTLQLIQKVMSWPNVWTSTPDTGAFGAEIDGHMIAKPMMFMGNVPGLGQVINKRLTPEQKVYCTPIQGKLTTASGEYPDALVHIILEHLQKIIKLREPQRFNINSVFAVAQPVGDLKEWDDIVTSALQQFERSSKRPYLIDPSTTVGKQICDLMRMDAVRIQVVWTPTTRRLPPSTLLEMTHRGALLHFADGTRTLELEHLSELQFPKQRFVKPVQLGIFIYGVMREVQGPPQLRDQESQPSTVPLRDLPTDVTFPGLPEGIPVDTRRMVARLHLNLGHPSSSEMTRMIAHYGGAPGHVLSCIQHLHCATCHRLKDVQKARPAATPSFTVGQFADEVQGDLFYVRLLNGENFGVLGLLDRATGFHQAITCNTRDSQMAFTCFLDIWVKPYGVPYRLLLDPDPTFRGEFQRQAESLGIVVEYCPAEAHWMIGAVERRNATLRCILEKLIDQWAVLDLEQFNRILPLAIHAMNSFTFTRGRTAYQAVFGRIPRLPGGLFTDDNSLASSPSTLNEPNNMMAKAEMIRAEAQKHLIDLNISQQLKRAMLRKTRATNYAELQPGQPCAYWRWQRRGPKKRGAWVLSRFLAWDPSSPTKLAWVRSGNTSILVTAEQLRTAVGFENWAPTAEDVKALKDATRSFGDHITAEEEAIEDSSGPPPPDDVHDGDLQMVEGPPPVTMSVPATPAVNAMLPSPSTPQPPVQAQPHLQLPLQQQTIATTTNVNIDSPTFNRATHQQTMHIHQRFGRSPSRGRVRQASRTPPPQRKPIAAQQTPALQEQRPLALPSGQTASAQQAALPSATDALDAAQEVSQQQAASSTKPATGFEIDEHTETQPAEQQHGEDTPLLQLPAELPAVVSVDSSPQVSPRQAGDTTPLLEDPYQEEPLSLQDPGQPSQLQPEAEMSQPSLLPQKRHFDALMMFDISHLGELGLCRQWPDGSPEIGTGLEKKKYFEAYSQTPQRLDDVRPIGKDPEEPDTTDSESDDDQPASSQPRMTRQEAKQLDRELPWREIITMPQAHVQKFLQAIEKEANSWMEWRSIKPLTDAEIAEIKGDAVLRRRVMKSRAAYRDKNRQRGDLKAKCRIVVLGHNTTIRISSASRGRHRHQGEQPSTCCSR